MFTIEIEEARWKILLVVAKLLDESRDYLARLLVNSLFVVEVAKSYANMTIKSSSSCDMLKDVRPETLVSATNAGKLLCSPLTQERISRIPLLQV